jgi:hypothetical protein
MEKILIANGMVSSDVSTGFISATNLNSILLQAQQNLGFQIKVGCWELNTQAISTAWVNTVLNNTGSSKFFIFNSYFRFDNRYYKFRYDRTINNGYYYNRIFDNWNIRYDFSTNYRWDNNRFWINNWKWRKRLYISI